MHYEIIAHVLLITNVVRNKEKKIIKEKVVPNYRFPCYRNCQCRITTVLLSQSFKNLQVIFLRKSCGTDDMQMSIN